MYTIIGPLVLLHIGLVQQKRWLRDSDLLVLPPHSATEHLSTLQIYPEQLERRTTTVTEGLTELLTMDP